MSGDQTLTLPTGAGVGGLGGGFTPDLNTGGGGYAIPLDLPPGRDGLAPRMTLQYATGHPAGPFGQGWALPVLRIERDISGRLPSYTDQDELTLPGAGVLRDVSGSGGLLTPVTDGLGWRIRRVGDGFEVTERSGLRHSLGQTAAGRVADPTDPTRVFAWLLERSQDPAGEEITYGWQADGAQRLLAEVAWAGYALRLVYEAANCPLLDGRPGFLLTTTRRCRRLGLHVTAEASSLVRSWELGYAAAESGHDLLASVTLTGHAADGATAALPALELSYTGTATDPPRVDRLDPEVAASLLDGAVLADLSGDGLPDVADLRRSRTMIQRNRGDLVFDPPQPLGAGGVPGFGTDDLFAADVAGRGRVDLISAGAGLAYRYPVERDAEIGRPLVSRAAPSIRPGSPGVRFADVDGDRAVDLVSVRGGILTIETQEDGAWRLASRAQTAGGSLQDVDTADAAMQVASMKGDGLADLVCVRTGEVRWWPSLGRGRWASSRIMANSPVLPTGYRADRVFLLDVDGDGCADLVYLDTDRLYVWFNRRGDGFSDALVVPAVPGLLADRVEVVDLVGGGASGLLLIGRRGARPVAYAVRLRSLGGYLLSGVDGALGQQLLISYGSSVDEAARDRRRGRTWPGFLPFPMPVVTRVQLRRYRDGALHTTRYRYHDGNWDTALRRFLGFAQVETLEDGDASAAGAHTVSTFHAGRSPSRVGAAPAAAEDLAAHVLQGRLVRSEVRDLDSGTLLLSVEQDWQAHLQSLGPPGGQVIVAHPRLMQRRELHHDGAAQPWRRTVTSIVAWDAFERPVEQEQRDELIADPAATTVVRTTTAHATNEADWILDRPVRVTQTDGDGQVLSLRITRYDGPAFAGLPEGQISLGRVSSEERLVLTDDLVTEVYHPTLPGGPAAVAAELIARGYHRRADVPGWFAWAVRYDRTGLDGAEPTLVSLDPRGARFEVTFDQRRLFPVRTRDARGNVTTAQVDARAARIDRLVDPNGGVHRNLYDPLGRLVTEFRPGDPDDDPAVRYIIDAGAKVPAVDTIASPGATADSPPVRSRELYDADGRTLLRATLDGDSWIVDEAEEANWRGLSYRRFTPHRLAAGLRPQPPGPEVQHEEQTYDALGRPLLLRHEDGTARRAVHGPGQSQLFDEEDDRVGGPHSGTASSYVLEASGRVRRVVTAAADGDRVTSYAYDQRNAPVRTTDSAGRVTVILRDLEGRTVRVRHADSGELTFLHDAAGNLILRRNAEGERVLSTFDVLNRGVRVQHPDTGEPDVEYHYRDTADASTVAVAGLVGRVHEVVDSLGVTTLSYDAAGEVATKRIAAVNGVTYELTRRTDRLGRVAAIGYPRVAGQPAVADVTYRYNRRGLLTVVSGVVDDVQYNAAGRSIRIDHANGTTVSAGYDARRRPQFREVRAADGTLLDRWQLTRDAVGNVVGVDTGAPQTTWVYTLDDIYELTRAQNGAGLDLEFRYDRGGNVVFRSGVGDLRYGEGGAPAGCLTSAGPATGQAWTYDAAGRAVTSPDGTLSYDPMDRLVRLDGATATVEQQYGAFGEATVRRTTTAAGTSTTLRLDAVAEMQADQLICYVVDGASRLAQFRPGGEVLHLHEDHRGTTVLVTGMGGAVRQKFAYDPFGRLLSSAVSGPGGPVEHRFDGYTPVDALELYLAGGRLYDPRIGRFLTPDPLVSDLWHPVAFNRYAYAANCPTTLADPTGRAWWHVVLAALAVVAVIVLTIVTFGAGLIALGAMIGVFAAMAIGGTVGGIAAAQAGGTTEQVLLGIFLGAAIAGAAALGGALAGAGFAAAWGTQALATHLLSGAVSGLLLGASTGFAAGWAGGTGSAGEVWQRVWQGALVGLVTGLIFGLASYGFQEGVFGTGRLSAHSSAQPLGKAAERATAVAAKSFGESSNAGAVGAAEVGSAGLKGGFSFASNFFTYGGTGGLPVLEIAVFNPVAQTLIVGGTTSLFALDVVDDVIDLLRRNNVRVPPYSGKF